LIEISKLSYRYNSTKVLNKLDLSITSNHYFALAGLNGSGKTTLFKLIVDLLRSTEQQSIQIDGYSSWDIKSRNHLAFLPERFSINSYTSALDYFKLVFKIYQKTFDPLRIEYLCNRLSFPTALLKTRASHYSKGMMQKVGLIGCFLSDVKILLLDEPLSGLDPKARYQIKSLLNEEKERNPRVMLYSTHMLADIEDICDDFGILHEGKLQFKGSPADCMKLYEASTLEQAYMKCIESPYFDEKF
jgi:ABC-2 type transport system ATP-binding protein